MGDDNGSTLLLLRELGYVDSNAVGAVAVSIGLAILFAILYVLFDRDR